MGRQNGEVSESQTVIITIWIWEILRKRHEVGEYNLVTEICEGKHESFFRYFRMSPTQFHHILSLISPAISKDSTGRRPISASERLAVTGTIGLLRATARLYCVISHGARYWPDVYGITWKIGFDSIATELTLRRLRRLRRLWKNVIFHVTTWNSCGAAYVTYVTYVTWGWKPGISLVEFSQEQN